MKEKRTGVRNRKAGTAQGPRSGLGTPLAVPLYPYQEQWARDASRFKIAVKATQIGYSFAAALEAVLDCLEHTTLWIVLSRGERQSLEFMQKVLQHAKALRVVGGRLETSFFKEASISQHEVKFPNGSRIIGLPANPDTARGYTGNMILDEFAFHQQDREIWAAAFGRVSRGTGSKALKLRVISTPNGQRGKFHELAKEAGLADGAKPRDTEARKRKALSGRGFSGHWCDVHEAVRQGCPIDVSALRRAIGDEETWQQEYECAFLSESANYIPLEMILACQSEEASRDWEHEGTGNRRQETAEQERELYFGYDVGRVRDLAVLAVVERVGDVLWTRALVEMPRAKFSEQERVLRDAIPQCARGAVDATGLGMEMAERLAEEFPGKVEPVAFTLGRKQDLAVGLKRRFEEKTIRIPDYRELRRDLQAVKRIVTSAGNVRFDAERTEQSHADRFWALALAAHAAGQRRLAFASGGMESERDWYDSGFGSRRGNRGQGTENSRAGSSSVGCGIRDFPRQASGQAPRLRSGQAGLGSVTGMTL